MESGRRYLRLELPGESVVLDVPAVPAVKRPQPFMYDVAKGYPHAMTYEPGGGKIIQPAEPPVS